MLQPEPRGLGDALTCARPVLGDHDVAVLLPDNLFERPGPMASVLEAFRRIGESSVLIAATDGGGTAGRAECRSRADGLWDVLRVTAKAPVAPSTLTPIGRWVFAPSVLAAEGRLIGVPLAGVFYDVGQPAGYRDALAALT